MRTVLSWWLVVLLAGASTASTASAASPELKTDDQKTLYAIGLFVSRSLVPFNLTPEELEFVKAGLADGVSGKEPKVDLQTYGPKIGALAQARQTVAAAGEKKASQEYLDKAAAEPGAKKTASGLIISEITPGTGPTPKDTDKVKVHYKGTLIDGTEFDSSYKRNEPATFPLKGVIKCWTEGLQLMKAKGKSKLVCPSDIAYGDRGSPPLIKPGSTLVFEVELLEIEKK